MPLNNFGSYLVKNLNNGNTFIELLFIRLCQLLALANLYIFFCFVSFFFIREAYCFSYLVFSKDKNLWGSIWKVKQTDSYTFLSNCLMSLFLEKICDNFCLIVLRNCVQTRKQQLQIKLYVRNSSTLQFPLAKQWEYHDHERIKQAGPIPLAYQQQGTGGTGVESPWHWGQTETKLWACECVWLGEINSQAKQGCGELEPGLAVASLGLKRKPGQSQMHGLAQGQAGLMETFQLQDSALALVEAHQVPLCPTLQSVQILLNGSTAFYTSATPLSFISSEKLLRVDSIPCFRDHSQLQASKQTLCHQSQHSELCQSASS